jgi:hypothetical protein
MWIVDYSANERAVGNGQEQDRESSSDEEPDGDGEEADRVYYDWELMRFRHPGGGESWLDYAGDQQNLYARRHGQTWPLFLLPDAYLPRQSHRDVHGRRPPYGSLNGNLAVLIGLTAFTADPIAHNVHATLMHTIRGQDWTLPSNQQRGIGCKKHSQFISQDPLLTYISTGQDQRGLLVNVYTSPEALNDYRGYERSPIFR